MLGFCALSLLVLSPLFVAAKQPSFRTSSSDTLAPSAHAADAQPGLTMHVFNNTALSGSPVSSKILDSMDFNLPVSADPLSLEVLGSLSLPIPGGVFHFQCNFTTPSSDSAPSPGLGNAMFFVWIDDHLVCQQGAYDTAGPDPRGNDTDAYLHGLTKRSGLTVRIQAFYSPGAVDPIPALGLPGFPAVFPDASDAPQSAIGVSVSWTVWPTGPSAGEDGSPRPFDARRTPSSQYAPTPVLLDATSRRLRALGQPDPTPSPISSSLLSTSVDSNELTRRSFQQNLTSGWGQWMHNNLLDVVLLPEAARITVGICRISQANCTLRTNVDGGVRVGPHAYDRSYSQLYYPWQDVNVSISVSAGPETVYISVEQADCTANCADYAVVFVGSFAFQRAGSVASGFSDASGRMSLASWGLRSVDVFVSASGGSPPGSPPTVHLPASAGLGPHYVAVPLAHAPVAVCSGVSPCSVQQVQSVVSSAEEAEAARYEKYGSLAAVKEAVQAGVMWNVIYTPAEYGPFAPVSRDWDFTKDPLTPDFTYVIFDWDNFFASYLLSLDSLDWAISNLIQVVKSKTSAGFVPNYSAGPDKSSDRTEPPVGAQVMLQMYKRWGADKMGWVVELLFDDLLDWHNWFWARRRLPPANLICLGSDPIPNLNDPSVNTMQGARYESGLDNSPQYDGSFFDPETSHMLLYDVGMTSMAIADADAAAELAAVIGRTKDGAKLQENSNEMRSLLAQHLWDEEASTFVNQFPNGTFYRRVAPTTFYPMLARAATPAQALRSVTSWLTNATRFAINPSFPKGQNPYVYWGLPSISADDPAYPALGYWRGYVWGPMAQLTYWSLLNYDDVPEIRTARKALAVQMTAMFMDMWNRHRHVCENFCPRIDDPGCDGDCTGSGFYHWGALAGYITLQDAGFY